MVPRIQEHIQTTFPIKIWGIYGYASPLLFQTCWWLCFGILISHHLSVTRTRARRWWRRGGQQELRGRAQEEGGSTAVRCHSSTSLFLGWIPSVSHIPNENYKLVFNKLQITLLTYTHTHTHIYINYFSSFDFHFSRLDLLGFMKKRNIY